MLHIQHRVLSSTLCSSCQKLTAQQIRVGGNVRQCCDTSSAAQEGHFTC